MSEIAPLHVVTTDETCPYCGEWIADLWECLTEDGADEVIECDSCGREVRGRMTVEVTYQLSTMTEDAFDG